MLVPRWIAHREGSMIDDQIDRLDDRHEPHERLSGLAAERQA